MATITGAAGTQIPTSERAKWPFPDIQANIVIPHGKEHVKCLTLVFNDRRERALRNWIGKYIAPQVTSMQRQLEASRRQTDARSDEVILTLHLAARFFAKIGRSSSPFDDPSYCLGMNHQTIQRKLNDIHWIGFQDRKYNVNADAMVLLAGDRIELLDRTKAQISRSLQEQRIGKIIHWETGRARRKQLKDGSRVEVEHFGFVDGISRPPPSKWHLAFNDEGGGRFGSYLVFRKLGQDVDKFHKAVAQVASDLNIDEEHAAAQIFGRFRDGTPLVTHDRASGEAKDDFNYDADPNGMRCPLHAHIRRANPRTGEDDQAEVLIFRNSIPYGDPVDKEPVR